MGLEIVEIVMHCEEVFGVDRTTPNDLTNHPSRKRVSHPQPLR